MTGKGKTKPKKVIETSLGTAPKHSENITDLSHLRTPITTSVHGLKQVFALFQTATVEVQEYIAHECDVMYECKTCRSIFRSLANFILHKRKYCREKCQSDSGSHENGGFVINDDVKTSDEDSMGGIPTTESKVPDSKKKAILPIINKLLKKQKIRVLSNEILTEDLSSKYENSDDDVIFVSEENNVVLQKIDTSDVAVFQTTVKDCEKLEASKEELMKSEIMEIHGILDNNQAALGPNGKICNFETNKLLNKPNVPKKDLVCVKCNFTFSTEKTLRHHIIYKHNKTCTVFPCPDCKETFSNAWSVYRHLYKVHRRTTAQVKRMRSLIHSSGIRKDQEPEKKKRKRSVDDSEENEENQWMLNIEGDKDFQMCGGCGKRFERKAALHSHSQMCTKRIAVCNSIKNVKAKPESKKLEKVDPNNEIKQLKGAAKRKQTFPTITEGIKIDEKTTTEANINTEIDNAREILEPLLKVKEVAAELTGDIKVIKTPHGRRYITVPHISEKIDEPPKAVTITKASDVTITKHTENETVSGPGESKEVLPEIEIFTISDESNDFDSSEKYMKREKRSSDFESGTIEVSDVLKEYAKDETDHYFLAKATTYLQENELKCIPCEETFSSLFELLRHMSLHFSWFRFQCSQCSYMSFHEHDCQGHVTYVHTVPPTLFNAIALPIPKWKVLYTSHDFKKCFEEEQEEEVTNNNLFDNQCDLNNKMPLLESIVEEKIEHESETIVLADDEMPNICTEDVHFSDSVVLLDDESRENHGATEKKKVTKAGPSSFVNRRPIRNRTKSVKIVQNDFIYDLSKVFKVNENSGKNKKFKKSLG